MDAGHGTEKRLPTSSTNGVPALVRKFADKAYVWFARLLMGTMELVQTNIGTSILHCHPRRRSQMAARKCRRGIHRGRCQTLPADEEPQERSVGLNQETDCQDVAAGA